MGALESLLKLRQSDLSEMESLLGIRLLPQRPSRWSLNREAQALTRRFPFQLGLDKTRGHLLWSNALGIILLAVRAKAHRNRPHGD